MNKVATGLAIASFALAASTIYLAFKVRQEARSAVHDLTSGTSQASVSSQEANGAGSTRNPAARNKDDANASAATGVSESGSASNTRPGGQPSNEAYWRVQDELTVRLYNDPKGRRELIEERIPGIRDKYAQLQRRLKVDDLLWQRFMEVTAEQELGFVVARMDCKATDTCNRVKLTPELVEEDRSHVAEVLGEAKAKEVFRFQESDLERRGITTLQRDIPDNQRLSEERSEELVMALNKVRDDTVKQMSAAQAPVGMFFGPGGGALVYDRNLPTAEERVEAASNYSKRLREQARKYLSAKLFAAFNQQQDEMLEKMRTSKLE
jgi:hypothetical protein